MKSMTGFGSYEINLEDRNLKVITKSLNDKYLVVNCKLPPEYPELISYKIEKMVPKYVKRGRVIISINETLNENKKCNIDLENKIIKEYFNKLQEIDKKYSIKTNLSLYDLLTLEKSLNIENKVYESEKLMKSIIKATKKSIKILNEIREKEGNDLEEFFIKSINKIEVSLSTIELSIPNFIDELKNKIKKNIDQITKTIKETNKLDEEKIISEITYYIDKSDITEEIVRLKSHLNKFRDIIAKSNKQIGVSMLFVIQEMQREISTISAKYKNVKVFPEVLAIKEEIDKCKEQANNVE